MILLILLSACSASQVTQTLIEIQLIADGTSNELVIPPGSNVEDALEIAGLSLNPLDKVDPPSYSLLKDEDVIEVVRVTEEFEVEQEVIPFEQQHQPSELLPEGEMQPLQLGENGLREITYRIVYENGVEVSRVPIKSVVIKEATSQIMLVGVQSSFTPLQIPGRLAFLSDGNAWLIEDTTGDRRPIITSGDLDGRVFSLSDNGEWLLFTRTNDQENTINTLWAINVDDPELLIDLEVDNVVHYADWVIGSDTKVSYSTVESRQAAPGWQANNDLSQRIFSSSGWIAQPEEIIETNSGGVYGWWGTLFDFSPDGGRLLSVSPDQMSILNFDDENKTVVAEITPLQTGGDWAWIPGVGWGADGKVLYTVDHAPAPGISSPEESQNFHLTAVPLEGGPSMNLVSQVGMFAYPIVSPLQSRGNEEKSYQVAFLQAIFPTQSETSRYRLVVMDRDGSNRLQLFPPQELPGLEPQREWGVWSPEPFDNGRSYLLAILYQGNIWLVDPKSAEYWQITGDGRVNRLDWK
ncbi:MAG: G5 domain-containing protein [Anaerolineales bacterium]